MIQLLLSIHPVSSLFYQPFSFCTCICKPLDTISLSPSQTSFGSFSSFSSFGLMPLSLSLLFCLCFPTSVPPHVPVPFYSYPFSINSAWNNFYSSLFLSHKLSLPLPLSLSLNMNLLSYFPGFTQFLFSTHVRWRPRPRTHSHTHTWTHYHTHNKPHNLRHTH